MNVSKIVFGTSLTFALTILLCSAGNAHSAFKKEMSKKYPDMKVSCNACHVDKQPKTERNAFGQLFHKEFEALELTKNWKDKKGAEKKGYETTVMVPAFEKALAKVSAMTYDEIIKAGLVSGIDDPNAANGEDDSDDE